MPIQKATVSSGLSGIPSSVAAAILKGRSLGSLRALSPLPDQAQRLFDDVVVGVGLDRIPLTAELIRRGLVFNLTDPLSVPLLDWETESEAGGAQRSMLPRPRGTNQIVDRTLKHLPIYATSDDFSLSVRTLRASIRSGQPLDTTMVEKSTRRVYESVEDALVNDPGVTAGSATAYGLCTAPNANTQAYKSGVAWDDSAKAGTDILFDVQAMVAKNHAAKKYGPYILAVPTAYGIALNNDFKANGDRSVLERLSLLKYGGEPLSVITVDLLPANKTVLFQATNDVVQMVVGQSPMLLSWPDGPGLDLNFLILAFMVPRVRSDYNGQSGICIGYTS